MHSQELSEARLHTNELTAQLEERNYKIDTLHDSVEVLMVVLSLSRRRMGNGRRNTKH